MTTLVTLNKEPFVEVCKEHDVKLVFVMKQTRKNLESGTAQHEARFTAAYGNIIVVLVILSEVFDVDNNEKAQKITETFEKEVQETISFFLNNGLNVREGVWIQ